jgi:hypothetical protein
MSDQAAGDWQIIATGGEGETPVGLKAASFRFALTPGRQKNEREI